MWYLNVLILLFLLTNCFSQNETNNTLNNTITLITNDNNNTLNDNVITIEDPIQSNRIEETTTIGNLITIEEAPTTPNAISLNNTQTIITDPSQAPIIIPESISYITYPTPISTSLASSQTKSTQYGSYTSLTSESEAIAFSNNGFSASALSQGLAVANNIAIQTEASASTIGDPFSLLVEQDYAYNLHTLSSTDDIIFEQSNFLSNSYTAMDFEGMLHSYRSALSETTTTLSNFQSGVIHDADYQYAKLQTGTDVLGGLATGNTRDIVIEFDISNQKVLIERIITNEDKIMVVSAATNLLTSLIKEDAEYLLLLYNTKCACKAIKNFLVGLLTESA
jgi:hypothetical protein